MLIPSFLIRNADAHAQIEDNVPRLCREDWLWQHSQTAVSELCLLRDGSIRALEHVLSKERWDHVRYPTPSRGELGAWSTVAGRGQRSLCRLTDRVVMVNVDSIP